MTENGRGAVLICTVTGNIGKLDTGCHTWSGNYKAGGWTATPWSRGSRRAYRSSLRPCISEHLLFLVTKDDSDRLLGPTKETSSQRGWRPSMEGMQLKEC